MNKEMLEKFINESKNKSSKKASLMELSDDALDKVSGGVEYFDKDELPLEEYQAKIDKVFIFRNQYCYVIDAQAIPNSSKDKWTIILYIDLERDGLTFIYADEFKDAVEVDMNTFM